MLQQDENPPHCLQDLKYYDDLRSDFEDLSDDDFDYKDYLEEVEAYQWEEIDS
jgi:hypothetical protein